MLNTNKIESLINYADSNASTLVEVQSHLRHKDISDTQAYVFRHFGQRNKKVLDHFPDPYQHEKAPLNS